MVLRPAICKQHVIHIQADDYSLPRPRKCIMAAKAVLFPEIYLKPLVQYNNLHGKKKRLRIMLALSSVISYFSSIKSFLASAAARSEYAISYVGRKLPFRFGKFFGNFIYKI